MGAWPIHQARSHWSEVLDQAEAEGPQIITHHGKERAVVLSSDDYRSLGGEQKGEPDFITFLLNAPKIEWDDTDLEHDASTHDREIEF